MGWFSKRASPKINKKVDVYKVIDLLDNGFSISNINRRLIDVPEVRIAINRIAETVSIVPFHHIREKPAEGLITKIEYPKSSFNRILSVRANEFQTPQTFFASVITRMLFNNNVFCLPEWDYVTGELKAIYPLPATHFKMKKVEGTEWVIFSELGTVFLYSDLIHLQRYPDVKFGLKRQSIEAYTDVLGGMQQAAIKQLETSGKVKALLVSKSDLKDRDLKAKLEAFKENFLTSENTTGFGMITGQYDVKPIDFNLQQLDTTTMRELTKGIYNYFGISENIINNSATELEYQQFINGLTPVLTQIAQELTYKLFTDAEIAKGNRIIHDELYLEIATLTAKTQFFDKTVYQGIFTRNEARHRYGAGWIEGGDELLANKNAQNVKEVNEGEGKINTLSTQS